MIQFSKKKKLKLATALMLHCPSFAADIIHV